MTFKPIVVGIGELLWDVFPSGPRLGGAPLNFACSTSEIAGGSAQVYLVSAVGDDALGHQARAVLNEHRVEAGQVQFDGRPTGRVVVEVDGSGIPSYHFDENSAWDNLQWVPELHPLANACNAVCFGTLGQRSESSQAVIQRFVAETPSEAWRVLDINLRPPYVREVVLRESLELANVLKVNDEELPVLAKLDGLEGSQADVMKQLASIHQLSCVAVTRGSAGATILRGETFSSEPAPTVSVVDTVGAGDAFTAALTLGLLFDQPLEQINQHAIQAAAYVCSVSGATTSFPKHLQVNR
ncbi:MAG: carbohydrate kinase [Planctomycetales bacterium]|nr:carbohydrate kinase [Planctomycetales bacterium]